MIGRANVASVSMGEQHSLFLDADGRMWACGENKEGQCGLGTPLDVIASQHRKAFYDSMRPLRGGGRLPSSASSSRGGEYASGGSQPQPVSASTAMAAGGSSYGPRDERLSQYLRKLMQPDILPHQQQHRSEMRAFAMQQAAGGLEGGSPLANAWGGGGQSTGNPSSGHVASALGFGGFDAQAHVGQMGLQPGQLATPMRIGRDEHPLSGVLLHPRDSAAAAAAESTASALDGPRVVSCAVSKYFSVAVTSDGRVWTFGACYNGSLGSDSSWSTTAQRVTGSLEAKLADCGGAVQVAAGGTFALALTATGRVVVWGRLPGQEVPDPSLVETMDPDLTTAARGGRTAAAVVEGLPPIRHIAAGMSHALLSDGERVWAIGKQLGGSGLEAGSATWSKPEEMLHLAAEGVQSISCGAHSSAAVSGDGQLYMWGRLLEYHHAESLIKRHAAKHAFDLLVPDDVRWRWSGFGSDKPTLVEGLSNVRQVALGGWHALALVD